MLQCLRSNDPPPNRHFLWAVEDTRGGQNGPWALGLPWIAPQVAELVAKTVPRVVQDVPAAERKGVHNLEKACWASLPPTFCVLHY